MFWHMANTVCKIISLSWVLFGGATTLRAHIVHQNVKKNKLKSLIDALLAGQRSEDFEDLEDLEDLDEFEDFEDFEDFENVEDF